MFIYFVFKCAAELLPYTPDPWWYGGEARLEALGGIKYAIPDITNTMTMYNTGYISDLPSMKNISLITLDYIMDDMTWRQVFYRIYTRS